MRLTRPLDDATVERAALAIYEFDEDLTDRESAKMSVVLLERRLSWQDLCETEPGIADGYRGRARVALLAALAMSGIEQ